MTINKRTKGAHSGLLRTLRAWDLLIFGVAASGTGLMLPVAPVVLGGSQPAASIVFVLILGLALSVSNGSTYGILAVSMPRSGADYVFTGRSFHPWIGFTVSWGLVWSLITGIGLGAAWCVSRALGPVFQTYGRLTDQALYLDWGIYMTRSPDWAWKVGTMILGSILVISLLGTTFLKGFLRVLFTVALAGTVAIVWVLFTSSHGEFVAAFDTFVLVNTGVKDAYAAVVAMAPETGDTSTIWTSLTALTVGYWIFTTSTFLVSVSGEVREPRKALVQGITGSLLFGFVLLAVALGRYYAVVGKEFTNGVAAILGGAPPLFTDATPIYFFAGFIVDNPWAQLLFQVNTFLWSYLLLFVLTQVCARSVYAWGMDRLLPRVSTRIARMTAAPWAALLGIVAGAELFLLLDVRIVDVPLINYGVAFGVCFLMAGVAAVDFPRHPEFDRAPALARKSVAGIPWIRVAGWCNVVIFTLLLIGSLTHPYPNIAESIWPGLMLLLTIYATGAAWYAVVRWRAHREGRDLDHGLRELPPG